MNENKFMDKNFLNSTKLLFIMYKQLAEKAIAQIADDQLGWQANEDCNSIITIVKHMHGNMLSRWTDFLTSDGEKPWRQRDNEFENEVMDRQQLMKNWEQGWQCVFDTLDKLTEPDLEKVVYIRNEGHTAMEAINRQVAHYAYHVGQIVFCAKLLSKNGWETLSIPRNKSNEYNKEKFSTEKAQNTLHQIG